MSANRPTPLKTPCCQKEQNKGFFKPYARSLQILTRKEQIRGFFKRNTVGLMSTKDRRIKSILSSWTSQIDQNPLLMVLGTVLGRQALRDRDIWYALAYGMDIDGLVEILVTRRFGMLLRSRNLLEFPKTRVKSVSKLVSKNFRNRSNVFASKPKN